MRLERNGKGGGELALAAEIEPQHVRRLGIGLGRVNRDKENCSPHAQRRHCGARVDGSAARLGLDEVALAGIDPLGRQRMVNGNHDRFQVPFGSQARPRRRHDRPEEDRSS